MHEKPSNVIERGKQYAAKIKNIIRTRFLEPIEHNSDLREQKKRPIDTISTDPPTQYKTEGNNILSVSDMAKYRWQLFNDEFKYHTNEGKTDDDIGWVTKREKSSVIQGCEEATLFAAGKKILDIASGKAIAAREYAEAYPGTTIVGIDTGYIYDDNREVNLEKEGLQLMKDDWRTLASIPDESMDTIITTNGPLMFDICDETVSAITRVAKQGAVLRFNHFNISEEDHELAKKLLIKYEWTVQFVEHTGVAVKNPS